MSWKCVLGHNWKVEYFGGGFPMRECLDCGKVQVKTLGSFYWSKAGKGVTLENTRTMYARFAKQKDLQRRHQAGVISWEEYLQESEELLQSFDTSVRKEK